MMCSLRGAPRSLGNAALALMLALPGCSGEKAAHGDPDDALPYARSVESFSPGEGAGFGQEKLPDIVLGPPHGRGHETGSLDVLSLGLGGEIVLGFGDREIVDGRGPDFVVFENPFWPGGDESHVYAELGEVSVSSDGKHWVSFTCDTRGDGDGHFPGCAGVTPTEEFDPLDVLPIDPEQTGGDAFDLADLEVASARFVKIRDLETLEAGGKTEGFDLDAVGVINER